MATSYTSYNANVNSMAYRSEQAPVKTGREARIERLQQWLQDRVGYEWTRGYKEAAAELKALEATQ